MRFRQRVCRRAAFAALAFQVAAGPAQAANCFGPQSSENLPFEVMEQAPPPIADQGGDWRYYPASSVSTMNIDLLNRSRAPLKKYWFQWANRCQPGQGEARCGWNPKGNILPQGARAQAGQASRAFFTSYAAADACTLAQAAFAMGADGELSNLEAEGRIRTVTADRMAEQAAAGPPVDTCPLPENRLAPSVDGIVLDYEVQDNRTSQHTATFLKRYAALAHAHGRRVILFTNPLDAPTQVRTGLDASNLPQIAQAFDGISMMVWSRNRQGSVEASVSSQRGLLGPSVQPHRVFVTFELMGTTTEDARFTRKLVMDNRFAGVILWRNRAEQGGACDLPVNRKIACLIQERCD